MGNKIFQDGINEVELSRQGTQDIYSFYGGNLYVTDVQNNFIHIMLCKGNGMAKLNRWDIDRLKDILDKVSKEMDLAKESVLK